ncbi:phage virion morphogenesis protein [Novosphingobium sp. FSY-8]|uniref:Phage virion morphogenesis protein n=1 Tax=Novosphingobium ovatum TaxID=1908523 RepID=A0ABW9XAM2_9SPHN|nr:phage virion morphogenesis protein [Novosphingobium ovatum]NBC35550.1 phage virion morphogenesis protein [Novosphingobium ovatum]
MGDDLARLEEWFGQILRGLSPAERRRATLKLGQALRKSNLARIRDNVQPDGSAMEPKKARLDKRGRLRVAAGGKMFQGLRYAKHWRIDAAEDGVEILPIGKVATHTASIHHFGETVTVGRLRNGGRIRAKLPERRMLGFSEADIQTALSIAADLLEPDA